ncbi:hypothetical protein II810_00410, partial [bacterium]|nr:hypothetical protein [bacterium]
MRKIIFILLLMSFITDQVYAEDIILNNVLPEQIEIPKNNIDYKTSLTIKDDTALQEIVNKQKEKDLEDIEALWKGTVDNNQVIGFALKKLATP